MLHAARRYSRRPGPHIGLIVFLGVALSQILLWSSPWRTQFTVLWLVAVGLSAVCAWRVPQPQRLLVALGSLVSFLSVLLISMSTRQLSGWWFVFMPLLGVVLVKLYLALSRWAVPIPDSSPFARRNSLSSSSRARGWRWFLPILITLHALSLGLYWAYIDHACSRFDLVRRVQGCAVVQTVPAFPVNTNKVQLAPSGTLAASTAPIEPVHMASPITTESVEAYQQQLKTEANTISLWDLKTGRLLRTLDQPARPFDITFSADDQLVATAGADAQVRVWRVNDGSLLHTIADARFMAFSADGSLLATANRDADVRLWSIQDGTLLRTITLAEDISFSGELLFSPDGSLLAVRDLADVTLWRVNDGTLHQTLKMDQLPLGLDPSFSFAPDGQTLATTGRFGEEDGGAVLLWRVADGKLLHTLKTHQALTEEPDPPRIGAPAFSSDGTQLVVSAEPMRQPNMFLIWRVADGALLQHIEQPIRTELVRFNADGTTLQFYNTPIREGVRIYTQRTAQPAVR